MATSEQKTACDERLAGTTRERCADAAAGRANIAALSSDPLRAAGADGKAGAALRTDLRRQQDPRAHRTSNAPGWGVAFDLRLGSRQHDLQPRIHRSAGTTPSSRASVMRRVLVPAGTRARATAAAPAIPKSDAVAGGRPEAHLC